MRNNNYKQVRQAGMIGLDALTSFFLIVTLSSIFLAFATINYFKEKTISAVKAPQAQLFDASFKTVDAKLGIFKDLIVSGTTKLNGDVFINGEKLNISELGRASENTIAGVASLQGESGDVTLTAGDGITIDGLKITNNNPNHWQNTFARIAVGSTSFAANSTEDTLTFAAGGNISIIPDQVTKKLTISGTATGWQLVASNVILTDNSYNVGVGTSAPTAKLDVLSSAATISKFTSTLAANDTFIRVDSTAANSSSGIFFTNSNVNLGAGIAMNTDGSIKFTTGNIATEGPYAANTKMTILAGGNVGIGTTAPTSFKLQVAGNIGADTAPTSSARTLTTVDSVTAATTGEFSDIFCLSATDCKIAYQDGTNHNLMMADCDDATCSTKTLTTVDSSANQLGYYASIYCVTADDCKISYYDGTSGDLMMADCDNATCSSRTLTTVDSVTSADTGTWTSIYCLSTTDCKISYRDVGNTNLMMADCDNATCSTKTLTTVDSVTSASTAQYTAIYCVSTTDCKIAYQDVTGTNLMMADCDDATCATKTLTTVDSVTSGDTGTDISIYCVSTTDCKIAYTDGGGTNLMMADCDNTTCSTKTLTTVDSVTSVNTGTFTSIYCVTATDCKISYKDVTNSDLMMADCDDATCATKTLTTVDSTTSALTGSYTSIYCPSATDCKIAYQDVTGTNLMMADCGNATCSSAGGWENGYNLGSSSVFFNSVYAASYFGKSTTISSFDLAENYKVLDESIGAGDLVTTEVGGGLVVAKSTKPYESQLLGIVSTKPGITLAEWEDVNGHDKRPVALAGRVPTRVNGENGPIEVGDYITSSSIPGVGMKATRPGRVVGVALEGYVGEGEGRIEVFVNPTYFIGLTFAQDVSQDPLFTLLDSTGTLNSQYSKQILSSEQTQRLIQEQAKVLGISTGGISTTSAQLTTLSGRLDLFDQELNNQQMTISSISATLASLPIINLAKFATGGAVLGITTVEEDFAVFGNTTLNGLNTIGNIIVANNLSLSSNSINTIGEDLQIQPLKQANVSFMDGLVLIDTEGNITIVGSIRADSLQLTENKAVGSGVIVAGESSIDIVTPALTQKSKIIVTFGNDINPATRYYVTGRQPGIGFTLVLDLPTSQDAKFDWITVEGEQ